MSELGQTPSGLSFDKIAADIWDAVTDRSMFVPHVRLMHGDARTDAVYPQADRFEVVVCDLNGNFTERETVHATVPWGTSRRFALWCRDQAEVKRLVETGEAARVLGAAIADHMDEACATVVGELAGLEPMHVLAAVADGQSRLAARCLAVLTAPVHWVLATKEVHHLPIAFGLTLDDHGDYVIDVGLAVAVLCLNEPHARTAGTGTVPKPLDRTMRTR
jgi:hypothetical protein